MIGTSLLANNVGAFVPAITYESRVINYAAGGTIAVPGRAINIYLEFTSGKTSPSLLCACDAYYSSAFITQGTLFNIIPE